MRGKGNWTPQRVTRDKPDRGFLSRGAVPVVRQQPG